MSALPTELEGERKGGREKKVCAREPKYPSNIRHVVLMELEKLTVSQSSLCVRWLFESMTGISTAACRSVQGAHISLKYVCLKVGGQKSW